MADPVDIPEQFLLEPAVTASIKVRLCVKGVEFDLTMDEARAIKDALIPLVGVAATKPVYRGSGFDPKQGQWTCHCGETCGCSPGHCLNVPC